MFAMPWRKVRPYKPGEMEFHLTGVRAARGEDVRGMHDEEWMRKRADKLVRRHRAP